MNPNIVMEIASHTHRSAVPKAYLTFDSGGMLRGGPQVTQVQTSEPADLAALVRYGCYQRVWQMVRSCHQLAGSPERQDAYHRVERAVLQLMDEEWPRLAGKRTESPETS